MASKIKKKRTSKYDSKEEIPFWGLRLSRYASLDNPKIMSFKLQSKLYQSRKTECSVCGIRPCKCKRVTKPNTDKRPQRLWSFIIFSLKFEMSSCIFIISTTH